MYINSQTFKTSSPNSQFYFIIGNVSEATCRNKAINYQVIYTSKSNLIYEPLTIRLQADNKLQEVIGVFDTLNEAEKKCTYYNNYQKIKNNKE